MLEALGEKSRLVKYVSSISLYIQYPPVIPPDVNAVLGRVWRWLNILSRAVRVVLSRLASLSTGGAAGLRCSRLPCASFTLDSPIHALKGMFSFGRRWSAPQKLPSSRLWSPAVVSPSARLWPSNVHAAFDLHPRG